ncbi:MAG: MiaB/RimO family radical SAM methylthiotransferase, partial [Acidobacteriota bacterium]|nr:MiaB/RimO family radical SAM methylthiotransferase [Acidobacteriota bacterium]
VNSYREPVSGEPFSALLGRVARTPGIEWIRFMTSHPKDLGDDIIAAMAENRNICRQLHLPFQSGSSAVLARMNRGYTREIYLDIVDRLRDRMPGIGLSTDIIVGFPGETEADFEETLDLVQRVRFVNVFSFRYSPRPGTAAARIPDDVPLAVKSRRLIALQALQKGIQLENNKTMIGKTEKILALGSSKKDKLVHTGRNEAFQVVNFRCPGDPTGKFLDVRITGCGPYSLFGECPG